MGDGSAVTRRLFPNPFSGRRAPIGLTSYFLLSPDVHLKLSGIPMSAVWRELGKESLVKSFEYHRRRGQQPPDKLCDALLEVLPAGFEIREAFKAALDAARGGDEAALNLLVARGEWATFIDGFYKGAPIEEYSYANRYVVALEAALVEPVRLIRKQDFLGVARVMESDELTAPLLSHEMSHALAAVTSLQRLGPVQWAITLETALSHLAAWSVSIEESRGDTTGGEVAALINGPGGCRRTPGAQFYRILMQATQQKSMMGLVNRLSDSRGSHSVPLAVETLKRWSAGMTLPEEELIQRIAEKCCPDQEEYLLRLLWVARYLTLLGFVTENLLTGIARHVDAPGAAELFAPWPTFPYGQSSFQSWCQQRYPFWYRYHQGRLAAGEGCPAAS